MPPAAAAGVPASLIEISDSSDGSSPARPSPKRGRGRPAPRVTQQPARLPADWDDLEVLDPPQALPERRRSAVVVIESDDELIMDDDDQHGDQDQDNYSDLVDAASFSAPPDPDPPRSLKEATLRQLQDVFPDIDFDYVSGLYDEAQVPAGESITEHLTTKILESKTAYPKERDRRLALKRKREKSQEKDGDEDDEAGVGDGRMGDLLYAGQLLREEFPSTPVTYINNVLRVTRNLFQAYGTLEEKERTYDSLDRKPYQKLKVRRKSKDGIDRSSPTWFDGMTMQMIQMPLRGPDLPGVPFIHRELSAARKRRLKESNMRQVALDKAKAEAANFETHREAGMIMDCQCCFDSLPFNLMTNCNGEGFHMFCLECARRNANNEIGQSRYKLKCMDSSGCQAEFDRDQIYRFLDGKTIETLDRIQQQEEIRLAQLDDLTQCPYCDFAAICPPVDVDREFRCRNPDCEKVTCRMCKEETHVPLTCEAYAKENGVSVRHAVEEAMTEALVRSCNQCGNKYVKEAGCNKMRCSRCHSYQCYVCSKTITKDYSHFNDNHRGGKIGNCPLFDNTDQRHDDDVQKAAAAALAKVKADNPNLDEEKLKVHVSEAVQRDEKKRIEQAARMQAGFPYIQGPVPQYRPAANLPYGEVIWADARQNPQPAVPVPNNLPVGLGPIYLDRLPQLPIERALEQRNHPARRRASPDERARIAQHPGAGGIPQQPAGRHHLDNAVNNPYQHQYGQPQVPMPDHPPVAQRGANDLMINRASLIQPNNNPGRLNGRAGGAGGAGFQDMLYGVDDPHRDPFLMVEHPVRRPRNHANIIDDPHRDPFLMGVGPGL